MSTPLQHLGLGGVRQHAAQTSTAPQQPGGPGFSDLLKANLDEANRLQQEASAGIEDLKTGRRDDVETVLINVQKADTAFRLLQAVRNKMVEAYQELQQLRV